MQEQMYLDNLILTLNPLREQVIRHCVYRSIQSIQDLRRFMEFHVFAVWDFMSLLKALQRRLTCLAVPWIPSSDPVSRRLINEIVLGEESDRSSEGEYSSHFEMYRAAMLQCGADVSPMDDLLQRLRRGQPLETALAEGTAPKAAADFVLHTWGVIQSNSTHRIAAAFAFGREQLIPDMFRSIVVELRGRFPGELELLHYYLERHIDLDEHAHTPMAKRMVALACGGDADRYAEACQSAEEALRARLGLWDALATEMDRHSEFSWNRAVSRA
jgi:hypothetical protein